MKIRTIFLLFVLILMAVFLVINWTALSTVTAVNLIYTEIQAPLGVLVVGGFAAVVFVLLVYMVWQQASVTLELRAAYKEARNARTVADDAEKSRFAESNRILLERIEKLEALMTARSDETLTAVRQEAVRAEERYKALFDDQKRAQGELTAQVQTQIGAMEKRVVETLPSAVSAAVPTQALAEEAEKKKQEEKKKKEAAAANNNSNSNSNDNSASNSSSTPSRGGLTQDSWAITALDGHFNAPQVIYDAWNNGKGYDWAMSVTEDGVWGLIVEGGTIDYY